MRITINIEKKHLYLLVGMLSIFGIFTIFVNAAVNTNLGYHPLGQISGLDEDGNGIVDNADKLDGLDSLAFCRSNGDNCAATSPPASGTWGLGVYQDQSCYFGALGIPLSGSCTPPETNTYYIDAGEGSNCGYCPGTCANQYLQTCS